MRNHSLNTGNLQKKGISLCEEWVKKHCQAVPTEPNVYTYEPGHRWEFYSVIVRLSQGGWSAGHIVNPPKRYVFITRGQRTARAAISGVLDKEIERTVARVKQLQEVRLTLDKKD